MSRRIPRPVAAVLAAALLASWSWALAAWSGSRARTVTVLAAPSSLVSLASVQSVESHSDVRVAPATRDSSLVVRTSGWRR